MLVTQDTDLGHSTSKILLDFCDCKYIKFKSANK
jgi:hypothetical protein